MSFHICLYTSSIPGDRTVVVSWSVLFLGVGSGVSLVTFAVLLSVPVVLLLMVILIVIKVELPGVSVPRFQVMWWWDADEGIRLAS